MHGDSRHAPSRPRRANGRDAGGAGAARPPGQGALPEPAELARLLEPVIRAAGMDLESVRVSPAGRRRLLRLVVDADGGVGLDQIADVSREVSARLDGSGAMGEVPYTLEVSSPGVDRPLTEPRHWRRARGRLVSAPLTAARGDFPQATEAPGHAPAVCGRVLAAGDGGVTLEVAGDRRGFAYAELGPGQVQVEFGRPGETGGAGTGPGNGGSRDGH
jgi:ribosome maturation factor RimP